jgi:hypothetical protein
MALTLEQLVYTSVLGSENAVMASPNMPESVQQQFVEAIVNPYWADQSFVGIQFRAAYLHQIAPAEILFGWVYCRQSAKAAKGWIPHFICYYLSQPLNGPLIELIFETLERGPCQITELFELPKTLEPVLLEESGDYEAPRPGVEIFPSVRARSRLLFDKGKLLHFFLPVEELPEHPAVEEMTVALEETEVKTPRTQLQTDEILTQIEPQPDLVPVPTAVKVALLIGVGDCDLGFDEIPGVQQDIESLRTVLLDPNLGDFTQVKTLLNPDRQVMAEAIEGFLSSCPADSLAILYFSGYGIWDNQGTFCLTTGVSRRGQSHKVVRSTIIPSEFLSAVMRDCSAQQKLLILDCCLSDDAESAEPDKRRFEAFRQQLNAPGLSTLISCTDFHAPKLQKGDRLSEYTFYLIEGLKTGIADQNADRMITIGEWHDYAMRKVQLASPAVRPLLMETQAGAQQLAIAQISADVVSLKYRREVERCVRNGNIPLVNDLILSNLQEKLDLMPEEADTIKAEVLKPHRDYQTKLQEYAQSFMEQLQTDHSAKKSMTQQLKSLQESLGLTDVDTELLRAEMIQQLRASQMPVQPPRSAGSAAQARFRALSVATTPETQPKGLQAVWFTLTDTVGQWTETLQQYLPSPLQPFFQGKEGQTKLQFLIWGGIASLILSITAFASFNLFRPAPEEPQSSSEQSLMVPLPSIAKLN